MSDPAWTCPVCGSRAAGPSRPYRCRTERWPADTRVVACSACGAATCDPMPDDRWLAGYYAGGSYASSHPDMSGHGASPLSLGRARAAAQAGLVARRLGHPPRSWLDVGAGFGFLLDEAAALGARTAGVEPGPDRRAALEGRRHEVVADVADAGDGWEVVSISHVLEHVPDPSVLLAELWRALAPGGLLLCEVPNDMPAEHALRPGGVDEPHVAFYSWGSLERVLERAGFADVRVGGAGRRQVVRPLERVRLRTTRVLAGRAVPVPAGVGRRLHHAFDVGGPERIWLRATARRPPADGPTPGGGR